MQQTFPDPRPRPWSRRLRQRVGNPFGYVLLAPAVILLVVFFYYPVMHSLYMSVFKWPLLGERTFIGLGNYAEMLDDAVVMTAWRFTFTWTLIITPPIFLLALLLAVLTSSQRRGTTIFRSIYFMPTVLTSVAAGLIWKWFFGSQVNGIVNYTLTQLGVIDEPIGWLGTMPYAVIAVAVAGTWLWVGLTMLLFVGAIQGIPQELYEAAEIDGASAWQSLRRVTLPLLRTTFGLALIISIIGSFMSFPEFMVMTEGGPAHKTTPILMWIYYTSFRTYRLGYGAALSFVLMAILVVLTLIQFRFFHRPEEL